MMIDFINVGYGDAILVRERSFTMLIDCGDTDANVRDTTLESSRNSAWRFMEKEKIQTIDLLVITHLHRDHCGGLWELLEKVHVKKFISSYIPQKEFWGRQVKNCDDFSKGAQNLLEGFNIYLKSLQVMNCNGTEIMLAEPVVYQLTSELCIKIMLEESSFFMRQCEIWQNVLEEREQNKELDELDRFINNTSVHMRIYYKDNIIELPGDIYANCLEKHSVESCTILKLSHHGHRDSITQKLLDMLEPERVVISTSNNRTDNCPACEVIQMIKDKGCKLYITEPFHSSKMSSNASVHFELD